MVAFASLLTASTIILMIISVLFYVFELLSQYKLFEKYGEPGWKGLIPIYSTIVESKKVWNVAIGIVIIVISLVLGYYSGEEDAPNTLLSGLSLALFVIRAIYAGKKSKAFGKGFGTTLLLMFIPFIGNLYLGLGDAVYLGDTNR